MNNNITCPNCGNTFDVENVIAADLEQKIKKDYQEKWKESQEKIAIEKNKLATEVEAFEEKKKRENLGKRKKK